jgi:glycosyltransferase involved in cell wall biosynthesis
LSLGEQIQGISTPVTPKQNSVLLVIPCYQESRRLPVFLRELCETLESCSGVSILVVDDGSGPEEEQRMRELLGVMQAKCPLIREPLCLTNNLGKGGAVYRGWQERGQEEWVAFVDADGSCSAIEVKRLIELARTAHEDVGALFASRVKILGRHVDRRLHRHLIGRVYATLVSEGLDIPVYDSQCGLKLVRRRAFERIESVLKLHGFAFDIELLAALMDSGAKVEEVPIDWHETAGSKLHLVRDSVRMFRDVLSVRSRRRSEEWVRRLKS